MIRIPLDELERTIEQALLNAGLNSHKALQCARVHASSSCDGVNSHGLNRVPRFIEYVGKGWIDIAAEPSPVSALGAIEVYDGHQGIGVTNALFATERAMAMAKAQGVGIVALRNSTHWMRGGSYGWRAAQQGFASICWTNTESCMPAWGAADCRVGNNPLVIAVPRSEGPLVLDMAMSQYSYGKLQSTRLQGQSLAYDGGYDSEGRLTRDPGAIEASRRILPTGYWKGSGLTIMLDAMAALLSQGLATNQIDEIKQGSGTGASQVFMLFDPRQLGGAALAEQVANSVADYVQASEPAEADSRVMYPGASTWQRRADNLQRGVPVDEDIWHQVQALAQA
jgi:3-dehydro-L-gulonate 2-dehydrogenase